MAYYSQYPQYVQPSSYSFHDRELDSPDEYFSQTPRYTQDRHTSQDFGSYPQTRDGYFPGYEAHNNQGGSRHYGPAVDAVQGVPSYYDHSNRHSSYSSSPTETSASRGSSRGSRGGDSPIVDRHSRTSSSSDERAFCPHPECTDEHGRPTSFFSRKADVQRHVRSQHASPWIDCPKNKCSRKGENGFTRQDHCTEHLRQYHGDKIPKRGSASSGRGGSQGRHTA